MDNNMIFGELEEKSSWRTTIYRWSKMLFSLIFTRYAKCTMVTNSPLYAFCAAFDVIDDSLDIITHDFIIRAKLVLP